MLLLLFRRAAPARLLHASVIAFALALPLPAIAATILSFDVSGGVTNFQAVPQEYGDNVAGSPDAAGHGYGGGPDFTPDVTAAYGTPGELPALWTSGYGDLTNVYFNDQDSDSTLTLTLTGGPGFDAVLLGFDIASFSSGGQTIAGFRVLDGGGATLFSQGATLVPGAASGGHATLDFGPGGLAAKTVILEIDLTGLAMQSDNVGIDNVAFTQAIPEPGTAVLLGLGIVCLAIRRRT